MDKGNVYLLPLRFEDKIVVTRQYKGYFRFYFVDKGLEVMSNLPEQFAFYGNYIHKSVPKEGGWKLLGKRAWTEEEVKNIPYLFWQDRYNYMDYCALVHPSLLEHIPVTYEIY